MENFAILLLLYKIFSLLTGMGFAFLGYRLFVLGIFSPAGDLDVTFKNNKLLLKKAAPGTFFALFGAIIIIVALYQGFSLDLVRNSAPKEEAKAPPHLSP